MTTLLKPILVLLLLAGLVYAGFRWGRHAGSREGHTQLTENYSFVREIAELATLEANGISTFKSTNLANDGSWTDALRKAFLESTVQLSVPYTAKYGVDLQDSTLRILRRDSVVELHLPQPRLLSFELRLDRMDASSRKGWLLGERDERYLAFQKKIYTQTRTQLEGNRLYLNSSRDRVCSLLQQYFASLHLRSVCIFDAPAAVINRPKD